MIPVAGRGLFPTELHLLREVLGRRHRELLTRVETIGVAPLARRERDLMCAAVVDEMCELGPDEERRDLELEELLLHLGEV